MLCLFQFLVDCGMLGVIRRDTSQLGLLLSRESCFHLRVACKFHVNTLELSFPLFGLFKDAKNVELLTIVMMS